MSVCTPRLPRNAAAFVSGAMLGLIMPLVTSACGLTDIRPAAVVDNISETEATQGRQHLDALLLRYGGAGYCAEAAARAVMSDDWGFFSFAGPWPKSVSLMQLQWNPCHDTGRVTYLDGAQRLSGMGVQNWETYAVNTKGEVTWKELPDAAFMIPTLAYFLEMPFRIGDADIVGAVGTEDVNGRPHHVVFATFGSVVPTQNVDQYLLYIDVENGLLTRADYTIRDSGEAMSGTALFTEHEQTGEYVMPHDVQLMMRGGRGTLHHMRVRGALIGPGVVPQETLYPDATRSREKGAPPTPKKAEPINDAAADAGPEGAKSADDQAADEPTVRGKQQDGGEAPTSAAVKDQ